jgi:hypothetical protein
MAESLEDLQGHVDASTYTVSDLRVSVAVATDFSYLKVNIGSAYSLDDVHVLVYARFTPDRQGPVIKRNPYPRDEQIDFPPTAPVVFFLRDEGVGVDINTVWVEIDGVQYKQGDPEFQATPWDTINQYLVSVRLPGGFSPNKSVVIRIYGLDRIGNPGVTLEPVA